MSLAISQSVRAKLESLLPAAGVTSIESGWVKPEPDLPDVFTYNYDRRRGTLLAGTAHKALGRQPESFMRTTRTARIGKLATDGWAPSELPRLKVGDTVYQPIDPVDGNTAPIRATTAIFRVAAETDADGFRYESGIKFACLEVGDPGELIMRVLPYAIEPRGPFYYTMQEYLKEHGLNPDSVAHQPTELLDFCIAQAQRSE